MKFSTFFSHTVATVSISGGGGGPSALTSCAPFLIDYIHTCVMSITALDPLWLPPLIRAGMSSPVPLNNKRQQSQFFTLQDNCQAENVPLFWQNFKAQIGSP